MGWATATECAAWGVLGSLAIAYGFAQAGIFNQRTGGLAAYAEDAYGKDGYFQVFFLYFLSLAIANVAAVQLGTAAVALYQREARDPARVDRRVDLPRSERPPAGNRTRRPRPEAISLSPPVAGGAR